MSECFHLSAARKFIKSKKKKNKNNSSASPDINVLIKLLQQKQQKQQKQWKKHRAYNVKDDFEEDQSSFNSGPDLDLEEKVSDEIAALFKNVTCKVSKSKWVADFKVFSHMTDQLRLFSDPLACIRRRIIKVKGKRLYVDHCDTVIMRDKDKNIIRLSDVLYVNKLDVNFLFKKRMCEKELRKSFD